jgi:hypothetical protein
VASQIGRRLWKCFRQRCKKVLTLNADTDNMNDEILGLIFIGIVEHHLAFSSHCNAVYDITLASAKH